VENDGRKAITTSDLLHMNSGLAWEERITICDATQMLSEREYGAQYNSKGSQFINLIHWNYSSEEQPTCFHLILRNQFKTIRIFRLLVHAL
jgi:hypothetical protein